MEIKKDDPALVTIADTVKPIEVVVKDDAPEEKKLVQSSGGKTVMAPNTTEEEETVTAGQRRINLMWETTQSRIAFMVVLIGMGINSLVIVFLLLFTFLGNHGREVSVSTVALITGSIAAINLTTGVVIGTYFFRTNHTQVGGTGKKATEGPLSRR